MAAAEALGVPVGTVRSRLSRARNKLRKIVDTGGEPGPLGGQLDGDRPRPPLRGGLGTAVCQGDTVRLLPDATDQRGRTGSAVAIPVKYEDGVTTLRVIFNYDSGNVLSIEQLTVAGKLRGYTLVVSSGWTDDLPPAK
jgi:hypothetical protein